MEIVRTAVKKNFSPNKSYVFLLVVKKDFLLENRSKTFFKVTAIF